jgi:hypothetical protein
MNMRLPEPANRRLTSSVIGIAVSERPSPTTQARMRVSLPSAAISPAAPRKTWLMAKELWPRRKT